MQKILAKLLAIAKEVPAMPKDKKNETQHYKYLSETSVKEIMRALLCKHGVVFQITSEEKEFTQIGTTKSGSGNWLTKVKVSYSFWDAESGEHLDGSYDSYGADTQDKGCFKAVTGAVKNILMQNFLIPTGDDPEKDGKVLPNMKPVAVKAPATKPATSGVWTPPVYLQPMTKDNPEASYSVGPMKWTPTEQKSLLASGKFGIISIPRKGGGYAFKLGNEAGEWDWIKDSFIGQLLDRFGTVTPEKVNQVFNQPT